MGLLDLVHTWWISESITVNSFGFQYGKIARFLGMFKQSGSSGLLFCCGGFENRYSIICIAFAFTFVIRPKHEV